MPDQQQRSAPRSSTLRVVYDKTSGLSISATLTKALAIMLRTGLQPLLER